MKQIVDTITVPVSIVIPRSMICKLRKKLNLNWVGDEVVNEQDITGRFIGKYDSHENFSKLQASQYEIVKEKLIHLKLDIFSDGTIGVNNGD